MKTVQPSSVALPTSPKKTTALLASFNEWQLGGLSKGSRTRTIVLMYMAYAMMAIDLFVVPSVLHELERTFQTSPARLGMMQAIRYAIMAALSPISAVMVGMKVDRSRIVAFGVFISVLTLLGVSLSQTFLAVVVLRAIDGISPAMTMPSCQSVIADLFSDENRGRAFGMMSLSWNLGKLLGSLYATNMAAYTVAGIEGWRVVFFTFSILSMLVGTGVMLLAEDPAQVPNSLFDAVLRQSASVKGPYSRLVEQEHANGKEVPEEHGMVPTTSWLRRVVEQLKVAVQDVWKVLHIGSFKVMILQGIPTSYAWQSMAFMTMWLEVVGFSNRQASILVATFNAAVMIGAVSGGSICDWAARRWPDGGRILCAQFSVFMLLPFVVCLRLIPQDEHHFGWFCFTMFFFPLFINWGWAGMCSPVLAEIVKPTMRTAVFAADRMFENLLASLGPYGTGLVAQYAFGYDINSKVTGADLRDAISLADSQVLNTGLPGLLASLTFTFFYWTYPHDRDTARAESARSSVQLYVGPDEAMSELTSASGGTKPPANGSAVETASDVRQPAAIVADSEHDHVDPRTPLIVTGRQSRRVSRRQSTTGQGSAT